MLRNALGTFLKLLLAVIVVIYVVRMVDPAAIVSSARSAHPTWVLFAAALLPLNLFLEVRIWRPFLPPAYVAVSTRDAMLAVLSGYPLGIVTPGRVGEFAGRALALPSGDRTALAVSVAAARVPELASILVVGGLVLTYAVLQGHLDFYGIIPYTAAILILAAVTLAFAIMPARFGQIVRGVIRRKAWLDKLSFIESIGRRAAAEALFLSTLRLLVYSTQFAFLLIAFAGTSSAAVAWEGSVLTLLAKSVIPPITLLDLGIREGAAVFFFSRLGVAGPAAFNAAFMLFVINLVAPTIAGLPLIWRYRLPDRAREARQPVSQTTGGGLRP